MPFRFIHVYLVIQQNFGSSNIRLGVNYSLNFKRSNSLLHKSLNWSTGVKQGSHRLEKYVNLEGFLEKSLKVKSALKSTGKSLKSLEKSLNSTFFCRT